MKKKKKIVCIYSHSNNSLRYPDTFTSTQDRAVETKTRCEVMIDDVLKQGSFVKKQKGSSNKKPKKKTGPKDGATATMKR